jgi:heme/copper-type cytochrome/quinol oxidase subunit 3
VIGSATVYQAVMLKDPDSQKRLTSPLILQLVMGCLYITIGVAVFGATIPVVQGKNYAPPQINSSFYVK